MFHASLPHQPDPIAMTSALAAPHPSPDVPDTLFVQLYSELRRLARREVHRNGAAGFVGTSTIVHEAWIDISQRSALQFDEPSRFLAYASRTMRGLVVDRVRAHHAQKRGGGLHITSLDTQASEDAIQPENIDDLVEALDELEQLEADLAQVIDLKYFCGFSLVEISRLLNVSDRTVQRRLEKARLLLHSALAS